LRLVPEQRPDETLTLLRAHLEDEGFGDVEVTSLGSAEPAGTPIEHPFVQRVVRVAEQVMGQRASIAPRIAGTLPIIASLQRHLGVAGLSAPGKPVYIGARDHAPNEHIRLEDLGHAVRFTHALLQALADAPSAVASSARGL
jgi:acetylornithine deacetylase/succinyl-diaminopimelate desuccinylase-like protein